MCDRSLRTAPSAAAFCSYAEAAGPGQDDEGDVFDAWVALHLALWAEGVPYLALHISRAVLHEYRRVGVALRHLLLTLQRCKQALYLRLFPTIFYILSN